MGDNEAAVLMTAIIVLGIIVTVTICCTFEYAEKRRRK